MTSRMNAKPLTRQNAERRRKRTGFITKLTESVIGNVLDFGIKHTGKSITQR